MDARAPSTAGLADAGIRDEVAARLGELFAGRPVLVGPGMLAAQTPVVGIMRDLGCRVLALSTARGAGPVPAEDECVVVEVTPPATASVTEELRLHDRMARALPRPV